MENASKALIMAGSILVGIILLSLGVYVYNVIVDFKKAESSTFTEEQLTKYNLEFLSYDKKVMYGTDVITCLNKAIDSNEKYAEDYESVFREGTDDSTFINIGFRLQDEIKANKVKYEYDKDTGKYKQSSKTPSAPKEYYFAPNDSKNYPNKSAYTLENNLDEIEKFLKTSKQPTAIKEPKNPKTGQTYTITYTGFSDFKRMIFKCTKVERNEIGKISYMEFEQIESSTYNTDDERK